MRIRRSKELRLYEGCFNRAGGHIFSTDTMVFFDTYHIGNVEPKAAYEVIRMLPFSYNKNRDIFAMLDEDL